MDSLETIYVALYLVGVTAKYVGFFHTSYAVYLSMQQPERLLLLTKWLYPDVAKHYHTNCPVVERSIRTAATVAWQLRPEKLAIMGKCKLYKRPSNAQFISIILGFLQSSDSEVMQRALLQIS